MDREDLFERVAAARCYVDRAVSNPEAQADLELAAFMSIFHPNHPLTKASPAELRALRKGR